MEILDDIMDGLDDFPTLPTIYSNLLDMLADPHTTADRVADLISTDPASTAKILKVVNSPLYGIQGSVETISEAIIHVGFAEVKNLVLALSVIDLFSQLDSGNKFSVVDFWKHSIAVGTISRLLAKALHIKHVENYYLAGILHDIGKIFFLKTFRDEYLLVVDEAITERKHLSDLEVERFGIDHLVVGGQIAEKWQLPDSISKVIRHHIDGRVDGEFDKEVANVCIADKIANVLELGNSALSIVTRPDPEIWEFMELQSGMVEGLYKEIIEVYSQSVSILSL